MQRQGKRHIIGLMFAVIMLSGTGWAQAAVHCVSTTNELRNALSLAATNAQEDTINIVQGTYEGSFVYTSAEAYAVTVQGGYTAGCAGRVVNPLNTVIDANGVGSALVLNSTGMTPFSVDGLLLRDGKAGNGYSSGIYIATNDKDVTISNCHLTNNYGAGLYVRSANSVKLTNTVSNANNGEGTDITSKTLTVLESVFTNNSAHGFITVANTITIEKSNFSYNGVAGGGIRSSSSGMMNVTLTDNRIIGNNDIGMSISGGRSDTITLANNTIYGNNNGGIEIYDGIVTLTGNTISKNSGYLHGGGCYISDATAITLMNNMISDNVKDEYNNIDDEYFNGGGGLLIGGATIKVVNNLIVNNKTINGGNMSFGGGLRINEVDQLIMTNNTITGNSAANGGGGSAIRLFHDADSAIIDNNIIYGNSAPSGADLYLDNDGNGNNTPSPVALKYNDFNQANPAGILLKMPITIDSTNLNNANPLFQNAQAGIYSLSANSPCLNVGNNAAADIPATDLLGKPRIANATVDLGAYEYTGQALMPGTLQFDAANYSVTEESGSMTITVTRTNGSDGTVTVQYAASDGTATAGSDYPATAGVLTFANGATSANFTIPILSDTTVEGAETITLTLSSPTGGATLGSPSVATLTVKEEVGAVLAVHDAQSKPGQQDVPVAIVLDVMSSSAVSALEFRLQYDAGVKIHVNAAKYHLTSRTTGFTANISITENGANSEAHVLLYTMSGATIAPGAGAILELLFNVDSTATLNTNSPLKFTQCLLSTASGAVIPSNCTDTGTFTIGSDGCTIGDLDCNGSFNIFDLQRLINCIFSKGSCANGDLNGDGQYNIFDVQQLVNKIFKP